MDSDSSHSLLVTVDAGDWRSIVTDPEASVQWVLVRALRALDLDAAAVEVSVLLTDDASVQVLNRQWRGKDQPTNVLSFPAGDCWGGAESAMLPPGEPMPLGDIVLALETVRREAAAEGKAARDHVAHLLVHGLLHLCGHDHEDVDEAEAMEALEQRILAGLGIADPYDHGPDDHGPDDHGPDDRGRDPRSRTEDDASDVYGTDARAEAMT